MPAGSTASDWLVLYVISTSPLATPSGWTLTASRTTWTAYAYYSYVFTRQKGSATDVTLAPTLGGLMMLAYQNVSGIGTVGGFSEAGGSTLALNAITPQHPQSQVLALTSDRDPAAPTPPAGFTTRLSFATSYFGQNFADKAYGSTASTGSPTWAQSSTYPAVGLLIELLPPPALPPTLSQGFSPASINQGGSSTLTFTLGNPNGIGLTNAGFSATLGGMTLANTTIGGTCVGVTANPALTTGASSVTLSVPSLPTTGCTVSVAVTSASVGNQTATTSGATAAEAPTTGAPAAPATLTVTGIPAAPTLQAAFAPAWIAVGGTSTLTVQVGNPSHVPLSQAQFSLSLSGMTLAEATLGGTCSGVSANPALMVGASSLDLTIASLPAAGCTLTLKVTSGTLGSNGISTSGVTTTENPTAGAGANPAYLTVNPAEVGFRYAHPDHLGTPRAITRPSDNVVVWKWENVEPFGNSQPNENPSGLGTSKFNLRFGGMTYYDQETGTLYNTNRDLDTGTGRYFQSDPIGLAGGINTYAYVMGNPLKYFDPLGLDPGDMFKTERDAAVDAGNWARRNFKMQRIEYGGWIYKAGQCFSYNYVKGDPRGIDDALLQANRPANAVAVWHTHPWDFSVPVPKDSPQNLFSQGDLDWSKTNKKRLYLRTPGGDDSVLDPGMSDGKSVPKGDPCECQKK